MKKKNLLIITSLLLLAAAAVLLAVFLGRPSIRSYAKEFGFSLDGIKEDVFVREHIDAFQDHATGFVVKLSGKVEGGDFDPARMTKGLSDAAKATVTFFNNDLKTAGKAPMQTLDDGTEYYFRRFVGSGGYAVFTVIYDSKTELYYMYWEGEVLVYRRQERIPARQRPANGLLRKSISG